MDKQEMEKLNPEKLNLEELEKISGGEERWTTKTVIST